MINFDEYTNENIIEHNSKWPYIPDHPYRILIVGGSGSGKTNALLNLINNQPDIDKIYLYAKDPYDPYGSMILEAKRLAKEDQEGKRLKILTPNQMLKRWPIALAQIKAGNNSESLLNEIRQIVYSLYRSKEITKKVYNNIINSIKV